MSEECNADESDFGDILLEFVFRPEEIIRLGIKDKSCNNCKFEKKEICCFWKGDLQSPISEIPNQTCDGFRPKNWNIEDERKLHQTRIIWNSKRIK